MDTDWTPTRPAYINDNNEEIPDNEFLEQNMEEDYERAGELGHLTIAQQLEKYNTPILYLAKENNGRDVLPLFTAEDGLIPTHEQPNVASGNVYANIFNSFKQTNLLKYSSSGGFHCLIKMNVNGEPDVQPCFTKFKIATLGKFPLATLSFNVNSRDHNSITPSSYAIAKRLTILINTGALNGFTPRQVNSTFSRARLQLICTRGGLRGANDNNPYSGAKVFSMVIGELNMPHILFVGNDDDDEENPKIDEKKILVLQNMIDQKILSIASKEGVWSASEDNSDIDLYERDELIARSAGREALNIFKRDILLKRVDECVVKFRPKIENYDGMNANNNTVPAIYRTTTIDANVPIFTTPIYATGDAISLRAHPNYFAPDHPLAVLSPYIATIPDDLTIRPHHDDLVDEMNTTIRAMNTDIRVGLIPHSNLDDLDRMSDIADRIPNPSVLYGYENWSDAPTTTFAIATEEEEEVAGIVSRFFHDNIHENAGCVITPKDRLEGYFLRLNHLWAPPEDKPEFNDCFFLCWAKAVGSNYTRELALEWRKLLGLSANCLVPMKSIQNMVEEVPAILHVWNIVETTESTASIKIDNDSHTAHASKIFTEVFTTTTPSGHKTIDLQNHHFLFHNGHCYYIVDPSYITNKVKCKTCTQWITRSTMVNHSKHCFYCKVCRRAYSTKNKAHECLGERLTFKERLAATETLNTEKVCEDWIQATRGEYSKKLSPESTIFLADIETFPDPERNFECRAYKCGIQCLERGSKQHHFTGENCLGEFLDHCRDLEGTVYFYNGGRFDCYLVIQAIIDRGDPLDSSSFIRNSGCIMSFAIHRRLKVHDLCLFIDGSLARACKDWGVPKEHSKGDFDHSKIYSWETAKEHDKEVTEYLKYDIISLRELFRIYTKAQFDCFKVDVNRSISLSQYAYKVWSAGLGGAMHTIFVPHKGKEENDDRAAYYGGRVTPQRIEYISKDFVKGKTHYDFEAITDYLIYPDVNSLYPAACHKFKYAFGYWKYLTPEEIKEGDYLNLLNHYTTTDEMMKCCYCVDIICPKDLITPFLMERTPEGGLVHTLKDKVKQWYWGSELLEAILIGYTVTTIHEVKQYTYYGPLFKPFIDLCWQGRIDNPKPSVKNLSFKNTMNKLTGKFGQRAHPTNTTIISTKAKNSDKEVEKILESLEDFDLLFDQNGDNHAIILEVTNKKQHPSYPIYLSAQILANSRVIMSQIYRKINAYLDPECAIFYTDTDSLIINGKVLNKLKEANLIGSGLGQLSCDLSDATDGSFAKVLTGIWAAPKGPYTLGFVCPNSDGAIKEKVKAKGIPHPSGPFPYGEEIKVVFDEKGQDLSDRVLKWIKEPSKYTPPIDDIKARFYHYQSDDGLLNYFAKHVNHDMIKRLLAREGTLCCYYGSFKKDMVSTYGNLLTLTPVINSRSLCKNDWWQKSKRIYLTEDAKSTDLTYPEDYIRGRECINYEEDSLIRLAEEEF